MTFRTWLVGVLREAMSPPASPPDPPTPNREQIPSFPTSSTNGSAPILADPATLVRVVDMMGRRQTETMREIREMVTDILQGRETRPLSDEEQAQVSRTRFDPPDYDAPGTEDLPPGLQSVFAREEEEMAGYLTSQTPQELYQTQLAQLREAAGMDPQGPSAAPSFSTESLGLQWPGIPT